MSPLPLNELRVGLCPDRLIVARFGGALRRKLVEQAVYPVKGDPVEELKRLAGTRRVAVVLSNHFVRYAVLPWSPTLATETEWLAYAQHHFISTYGDLAKTWDVRVCAAGRGNPAIVCAVDRALVQLLRQLPGLISLQPHLMAAFNTRRSGLPAMSLWFVLQERGRVTLGLIAGGKWKLIRNRQAAGNWRESLADLLDREAAACADTNTDCAALCAEDEPPQRVGRYRVLDLTLPRNADPGTRPIRMALNA